MSSESDDQTINLPEKGPDDSHPKGKGAESQDSTSDIEIEPTLVAEPSDQVTLVTPGGGAPPGPVPTGDDMSAGDDEATLVPDDATTASPIKGGTGTGAPAAGAAHVFANRFEVVALLGEGGMGRVYQVRDRQIEGREVALKVLRPKFSRNSTFRNLFFQEIQAAQKFVSEQVNQVRDTGQMEDGRLFLTMDLVSGESLRDSMKREGQMNTRHALEVTRQLLLALQSGHEQGFVHRDIKPPNVMLAANIAKTDDNPYGIGVRLLDFGIAALAAEVGEGAVSGTPMYMSPEQSKGERMDARSDLFSVGIVLYEMLSGSRPFEGKTLQEISTALVETQVAPMVKNLDNLKPAIQKILRKALEKDREKRFQSAKEFIDAITKSKAYRMPTGAPAWVSGLLAVSLIGNGGIAWRLYQDIGIISGLNSQNADATNAKQDAVQDEREKARKESQTATSDQMAALNAKDLIIKQMDDELELFRNSDVKDELNEGIAKTALQTQAQQIKELNDRLDIKDLEKIAADKAKDDLLKENRELQSRLNKVENASEPAAVAAKGFDALMGLIGGGHWVSFLNRKQSLDSEDVFQGVNVSGAAQLAKLEAAVAGLNEYLENKKSGQLLDSSPLKRAARFVEEAQVEIELFKKTSGDWIGFPVDGDEVQVNRIETYALAISSVKASIDENLAAVATEVAASKENIINGPVEQDPAPVIGTAADGGWGELMGFLTRLIDHFESAESGSELDLGMLGSFTTLGAWGEYVRSPECDMPPEQAAQIKWFDAAKRWYIDKDLSMEPVGLDELPTGFSSPKSDWRAVLALHTEIAAKIPNQRRHSNFYKESRGNIEMWIRYQAEKAETNGDETTWGGRRYLNLEKGRERNFTFGYTFQDGVLIGDASEELFSVIDSDARIGYWTPSGIRNPRNFNLFPTAEDVEQFNEKYSADGLPCLVVDDSSGVERWYTPSIGIVRERSSSKVLELFYR